VVLQELYLDKYGKAGESQKRFARALYGKDHPYARDTVEKEIALAKTAPAKLALRLRRYAADLRLPANMDLFLAGGLDPGVAGKEAERSFGAYPYAKGPMFDFPRVDTTRAYARLVGPSNELSSPMCQLVFAWNTGVCIRDPDARVLMALREYLDGILLLHLREKFGDAYTPEVEYEPDGCSGVFTVSVTSSVKPATVERRVFEAIASAKQQVNQREVARFKSRAKLKRLKSVGDNMALVKSMVEFTTDGGSADDLAVETVTADEILAAAQRYLPAHEGAYVRLALRGQ
jgi:predicted Zn-dependent peptidase